jgi:hypothetical protein
MPFSKYCSDCVNTPLVIDEQSCLVCPECGMEQNEPINDVENEINTHQAYTHSYNSFYKYIMSVQGRRSHLISRKRVEELQQYLEANEMETTQRNILKFLKSKKLCSEYYRVNDYFYHLTGIKPPQINHILLLHLRELFRQLHDTFHQKDRRRKNLLENSYILLKLLELNNHSEVAHQLIPFLKKFTVNDTLWEELCKELGWTFMKTVPYSIEHE